MHWAVRVIRAGGRAWTFGDGWERFQADNRLRERRFCVFKWKGNGNFSVRVFHEITGTLVMKASDIPRALVHVEEAGGGAVAEDAEAGYAPGGSVVHAEEQQLVIPGIGSGAHEAVQPNYQEQEVNGYACKIRTRSGVS